MTTNTLTQLNRSEEATIEQLNTMDATIRPVLYGNTTPDDLYYDWLACAHNRLLIADRTTGLTAEAVANTLKHYWPGPVVSQAEAILAGLTNKNHD